MENLKKQIENYVPYDEQEEKDKEYFLKFINDFDDVLTRNNEYGHFSGSAFVVNKDRTKMLAVWHNIYEGWIFPGGHADGIANLIEVARREVEEETGVKSKLLDENFSSIDSLPCIGHMKRGKYVSAHIHLNVTFLLEADDTINLKVKADENSGVKWISFEDACNDDIVDFARPIHKKIIEKIIANKL